MSHNLNQLDQLLIDFTQNSFDLQETLQVFKEALVHIFPQIHFIASHTQELNGTLKSYTTFASPLKLGNDELGIAIFECESIKAKIGIHTELKSLLKSSPLNAILAIFYTTDSSEFRLSLITKTYDFSTDKFAFSNLKRQSFVLGQPKVATAHNALKNLINSATKSQTTLKDLESAFSQEAVSNEFYKGYEKHYKDICQKLTNANLGNVFAFYRGTNDSTKAIESFAKKLLGRIVFLYFLQKKRWLGVPKDAEYGSGDLGFLHKLFCKAQQNGENFYATYLCPLFFDSLNLRKENDYSALFDCKIPFLNGGLFEDEFNDSSTSQSEKAHFLIANVLDNDIFREIFDFFESYNFTIEESTPTDTEVSIDPEMLGKVFENLIDYNKASGAFYTPREIVHYMCQSALISHFLRFYPEHRSDIENLILHHQSDSDFICSNKSEIKAKLLNLKILDPAIGSGAFPMGLLLEIMQVLESLDKTMSYEARARHKRDIIANCIYGIDIDSGAIEIAKLRFWLSIAVDEVRPSPLPNLDFKFMQGNSLLECLSVGEEAIEIIPKDFMKDLQPTALFDTNADKVLFQGDTAKKLQNLFLEYYAQSDFAKKQSTKAKIIEIMQGAFDAQIARITQDIDTHTKNLQSYPLNPSTAKKRENLSNKIESLMMHAIALQSLAKDFIDNDFHTDKLFLYNFFFANIISEGGFDIVIGNPPYIKEADNKKAFENTKHLRTYQGKMDIWYHFVGVSFDILKNGGILTFIATNNWTTNAGAQRLRNVILSESQILNLVDFGSYMCFATASIQTMIMEFRKSNAIPKSYTISYSKIEAKNPTDEHRNAVLNRQNFEDNIYLTPTITPSKLCDKTLSFVDSDKDLVLNKILKSGKFYLQKNEVWQGLVHPQPTLDKAMVENLKEQNQIYSVGDGVFNLNIDEIKGLALSKKEKDLLKPYYESNHLLKYYGIKQTNIYVIYTDSSFKKPNSMDKYPNLKSHLDKFQSIITSDNKPYGLHRARKQNIFEGNKILSRVKCVDCPIFTYVDFDCYVGLNFNIIKTSRIDMKYLVGILNSKLVAFWLKHKGKMQGNNYQINQEPLLNIPIVEPNSKNKKIADEIVNLVDKILESKKQGIETNNLEKEIDELIFRLYSLDSREIDIIKT